MLKEQLVNVLLDKPYWSLTVRSCFSSLASSSFTDQRLQIEAQSSAYPRQKGCSHTSPVYFHAHFAILQIYEVPNDFLYAFFVELHFPR